jgi:hypothetical protein
VTTLAQAVKSELSSDGTLSGLATYFFDSYTVGEDGLTRDMITVPGTPNIAPTVYIKWSTKAPFDMEVLRANEQYFEVYCYQQKGYSSIELMRQRVFELLHLERVDFDTPAGDICRQIEWAGDILGMRDEGLKASMERSRFRAVITRSVTASK